MHCNAYSVGDEVHVWSEFYQAWMVDRVRKVDMKCKPEMFFVGGQWVNHSRLRPANETGRAEGRRETLWNVYAACMFARGSGRDFYLPLACSDGSEIDKRGFHGLRIGYDTACWSIAESALEALAAMGDEQARRILEEA